MLSIDVNLEKKFGDGISSFAIATITYCSCITQFPYVVQKCYCASFYCGIKLEGSHSLQHDDSSGCLTT